MEQGIRTYFKRIIKSISTVLLWMLINTTAGVMFGHAFFEHRIRVGNIIFYAWFVLSLIWIVRFLIRTWRKPIEADEDTE